MMIIDRTQKCTGACQAVGGILIRCAWTMRTISILWAIKCSYMVVLILLPLNMTVVEIYVGIIINV